MNISRTLALAVMVSLIGCGKSVNFEDFEPPTDPSPTPTMVCPPYVPPVTLPTPSPEPSPSPTEDPDEGDGMVYVCHKPHNKWRRISIPVEDVDAHLAHGDYLGECPEDE